MPFVSLIQKDLQKVLGTCTQVSPKKSDVDIFTYTKVVIGKADVVFSCINSHYFFQKSLPVSNLDLGDSEKVEFLIKTELFAGSVSMIFDEVVGLDLDLDKNTLIVQGSKSKHTLRVDTQTVGDFITPESKPEESQVKLSVSAEDLIFGNKGASVSVGNPKTVYQPEFLNICYSLKPSENKISVVSTDRYRIVKTNLPANFSEVKDDLKDQSTNFLLGPRGLSLLNSVAEGKDIIDLNFEKDYLWVKIGESVLVLRYGDGKYPDYEKIIAQSFACSFILNTNELLNALKQVYITARNNISNKSITIEVDPTKNKLTLSANTSDGYSSESVVDMSSYEGSEDSWKQSFNADYLIEYLNTVKTENILWESNPGKPAVLSPENKKETQLYLVSGLK